MDEAVEGMVKRVEEDLRLRHAEETREHAAEALNLPVERGPLITGDQAEIPREQKMLFQLMSGATSQPDEPFQLRVSVASTTLGDVGAYRRCRSPDLVG